MASPVLRRAAASAADDPFFLGAALAIYQAGEGLSAKLLAQRLGCPPADLQRLVLCRRPDSSDAGFADDVRRIADWAGVDADSLVNIVRYAESVWALREKWQLTSPASGALLAARDRQESEDDQEGSGEAPAEHNPDA